MPAEPDAEVAPPLAVAPAADAVAPPEVEPALVVPAPLPATAGLQVEGSLQVAGGALEHCVKHTRYPRHPPTRNKTELGMVSCAGTLECGQRQAG